MARGPAMDRARSSKRSRGVGSPQRRQAGRDSARSDDAGDGRLCGRRRLAEGGGLAGHPGHCHYLARSRRQRPRAIECRRAVRARQGEVPAGRPGGAHSPAGAQQGPGQQRDGSSIVTKVLYVEDNDDNVFMLKMRLELLGDFEVLTAEDGEKGGTRALAERPDIIWMALEMPVVDGWEAQGRLRATRKPATSQSSRCPRTRSLVNAKRRSRRGATSSTPSRSNSIGWSQPFAAFSPTSSDRHALNMRDFNGMDQRALAVASQ